MYTDILESEHVNNRPTEVKKTTGHRRGNREKRKDMMREKKR